MMMQLLLGGMAGIVVLFRLYWHRFTTFIGVRKTNAETRDRSRPLNHLSRLAASSPARFVTVLHGSSTETVWSFEG